jgi:hypothetical protein
LRLIHPMVRSTIQRFGSTTKRWRSRRCNRRSYVPVRATALVMFVLAIEGPDAVA